VVLLIHQYNKTYVELGIKIKYIHKNINILKTIKINNSEAVQIGKFRKSKYSYQS